jgi:hypothetical protein
LLVGLFVRLILVLGGLLGGYLTSSDDMGDVDGEELLNALYGEPDQLMNLHHTSYVTGGTYGT